MAYFILPPLKDSNRISLIANTVQSFGVITFTDVNLDYAGDCGLDLIQNLFMMLEILSGMTLIIFSIATYLSDSDSSTK